MPVSQVKNHGEQVKYSVVAELVSPVKNNGEEGKKSDKGAVSPVPVSPVKNSSVIQKSASSDSLTEMTETTDSTDSVSKAPTVMTATCKATTCKQEYAAVFGLQNSPTQEEQS